MKLDEDFEGWPCKDCEDEYRLCERYCEALKDWKKLARIKKKKEA